MSPGDAGKKLRPLFWFDRLSLLKQSIGGELRSLIRDLVSSQLKHSSLR